jgi:hypothetical protein
LLATVSTSPWNTRKLRACSRTGRREARRKRQAEGRRVGRGVTGRGRRVGRGCGAITPYENERSERGGAARRRDQRRGEGSTHIREAGKTKKAATGGRQGSWRHQDMAAVERRCVQHHRDMEDAADRLNSVPSSHSPDDTSSASTDRRYSAQLGLLLGCAGVAGSGGGDTATMPRRGLQGS